MCNPPPRPLRPGLRRSALNGESPPSTFVCSSYRPSAGKWDAPPRAIPPILHGQRPSSPLSAPPPGRREADVLKEFIRFELKRIWLMCRSSSSQFVRRNATCSLSGSDDLRVKRKIQPGGGATVTNTYINADSTFDKNTEHGFNATSQPDLRCLSLKS